MVAEVVAVVVAVVVHTCPTCSGHQQIHLVTASLTTSSPTALYWHAQRCALVKPRIVRALGRVQTAISRTQPLVALRLPPLKVALRHTTVACFKLAPVPTHSDWTRARTRVINFPFVPFEASLSFTTLLPNPRTRRHSSQDALRYYAIRR